MHKWANPTLTCTSCHVYRGDKCHAHPKQALSTARQQGRGVLEPLYTTTSASSSWSRPRNICSACLSRLHLPRRSPPFIWLGPQPTQKCWQQWPTDDLTPSRTFFLRHGEGKRRLAHAQVENEIPARAGRCWGARVSTVDCARSPYGEPTFKRNRPSFAVLMVLGGGGAEGVYKMCDHKNNSPRKGGKLLYLQYLPSHIVNVCLGQPWQCQPQTPEEANRKSTCRDKLPVRVNQRIMVVNPKFHAGAQTRVGMFNNNNNNKQQQTTTTNKQTTTTGTTKNGSPNARDAEELRLQAVSHFARSSNS